jgi:hypothetical protein
MTLANRSPAVKVYPLNLCTVVVLYVSSFATLLLMHHLLERVQSSPSHIRSSAQYQQIRSKTPSVRARKQKRMGNAASKQHSAELQHGDPQANQNVPQGDKGRKEIKSSNAQSKMVREAAIKSVKKGRGRRPRYSSGGHNADGWCVCGG